MNNQSFPIAILAALFIMASGCSRKEERIETSSLEKKRTDISKPIVTSTTKPDPLVTINDQSIPRAIYED